MATIKDIARAAGVSQGTVSNVLNGKGNVSSVKILKVQQAAEQLGYAMNHRAQVLRRGSSNTLAVVLPSLYSRTYVDFFTSFRNYALQRGYQVSLYLTDDIPAREQHALEEIQSAMTAGAAILTCMMDGGAACEAAGIKNVCFIERSPGGEQPLLSFNFYRLGCDMAARASREGCRHPAVICENAAFSSQQDFLRGLDDTLAPLRIPYTVCHSDTGACAEDIFAALAVTPTPDALLVSNHAMAQTALRIVQHFSPRTDIKLYAASPLFSLPSGQCTEFELNYRKLGRLSAEKLIARLQTGEAVESEILAADGVRTWKPGAAKTNCKNLTIVTTDSPSARILRSVSQLYTRETGVEINIVSYSEDGMLEILSGIENISFDIIRLSCKHLPAYAEHVFAPLKEIDPDIESLFDAFIPDISRGYSHVNGTLYALPTTPSAQLLFYRRDLFENPIFRRRYSEMYGAELLPPTTYAEYNRIARFFTRSFNPDSPVPFGTGLALDTAAAASKAFLSRYFSYSDCLYDKDGRILLDSPAAAQAMTELVALRDCVDPDYFSGRRYALDSFAEGDKAMTIAYTNFIGNIVSARSRIADRTGFAMVPGGNPMLGGSSIGVCRTSRNKEEAVRFLRWLCSEEVSTAMALMGTTSPCTKTYEHYAVIDRFPWLLMARDCFAISRTSHIPPDAAGFDESKFLSILGAAVNTAFSGAMPIGDTLKFAQRSYEKSFIK